MRLRNYVLVTAGYWAFTLTDGALRMLVLLYFHDLGFSPVSLAFLFLLYEFMGIVTNLLGGWVGARRGLNQTLVAGLGLQIVALVTLSLHVDTWTTWVSVAYVMGAQALSGVAKDLTKMSSKSAVKFVAGDGDHALFRLVAALTGSKNALKGVGFFLGGLLRLVLQRTAADDHDQENRREQGVLFGSGLVGGEGLLGVGIAIAAGYAASRGVEPWSIGMEWAGALGPWLALAAFLLLVAFFWKVASERSES